MDIDFNEIVKNLSSRYAPFEFQMMWFYDINTLEWVITARLLGKNYLFQTSIFLTDEFVFQQSIRKVKLFISRSIIDKFDKEYNINKPNNWLPINIGGQDLIDNSDFLGLLTITGPVKFNPDGLIWDPVPTKPQGYSDSGVELKKLLPGLKKQVDYPCKCKGLDKERLYLWSMIIHLNDKCKWSREEIADWLETLPSEIDLTFKEKVND